MGEGPTREFLKSDFGSRHFISDQQKGAPYPPVQLEAPEGCETVKLPSPDSLEDVPQGNLFDLIKERRSCRVFKDEALSLRELAFLLWATVGVHEVVNDGYCTLRSVPSAGARHAIETYLAVRKIEGLKENCIYRYQPIEHELILLKEVQDLPHKASVACLDQRFVGRAAVTFFWVCVPYRAEWRYGTHSYKNDLLDSGHIGQNLYMAAESIDCGTCAIAAYSQELCDELLGIDGEEALTVYLSPVGKKRKK